MSEDKIDQIRSEEVQEILSHIPSWIIRWGNTLIFILLLLVIFLSWLIKYPDTLAGSTTVTTSLPPIKLVSKINGQIQLINTKEGEEVLKGDVIAIIESPLSEDAVSYLNNLLLKIEDSVLYDFNSVISVSSDSNLFFGDIQSDYNALMVGVADYQKWKLDGFKESQLKSLKSQVKNYQNLLFVTRKQISLVEKELSNAKARYKSDKKMFDKGVISQVDFYERESVYNSKEVELQNMNKAKVQNQITLVDFEKQLATHEYENNEKERKYREQITSLCDNIKNQINSWSQNYTLVAPFDGRVSFLEECHENKFIQAGTNLVAVIPNKESYVAQITLSSQGFGKTKVGQKVNIKLDQFPQPEYGMLTGKVKEISQVANENTQQGTKEYLIKVDLGDSLITSYNKALPFKAELFGTADIITEDRRLISRLFNQFKKLFEK